MKKYIIPHIYVEAINPANILLTSGGSNVPKASGSGEQQIKAL